MLATLIATNTNDFLRDTSGSCLSRVEELRVSFEKSPPRANGKQVTEMIGYATAACQRKDYSHAYGIVGDAYELCRKYGKGCRS